MKLRLSAFDAIYSDKIKVESGKYPASGDDEDFSPDAGCPAAANGAILRLD